MSISTVYLVSCVGQKQSEACCARDLYTSDWFKKARRYVESFNQPWFILSAEHGLVAADEVITPYERTLNTMKAKERRAWADRVIQQIKADMPPVKNIVFLAGSRYRETLEAYLTAEGCSVAVPMRGITIGKQLQWLKLQCPAGE